MVYELIGSPELDTHLCGVKFRLWVDEIKYTFTVSEEALADLIGATKPFDLLNTYTNHQDKIHQVAKKLVRAKIQGDPIVITTAMLN